METNEKILEIIKEKGPILPVKVSKEIEDNILMTSARLSELLTARQIKISSLKVGGSPLYYYSGQETKLQDFVDNLNGTEKRAYDLIKQHKALKDSNQEPAIRVALRQIKDFAVPLQANYENKTEIFWKWYLLSNEEASLLIRNMLTKKEDKTRDKAIVETNKETEKTIQKELKDTTKKTIKADTNLFLRQIHNFFNNHKIRVIETYDTDKGTEKDSVIELQTSIGNIRYFCKSRNKKKISDADLSSAVIQSQSKNLPLLFLTSGILTKKAQKMLENEFKNITFRKI